MRVSTVYLDMDGVLADFVGGALRAHGAAPCVPQLELPPAAEPAFWAPLSNPEFWAGLDPLDDGMELARRLIAELGESRVCVVSSGECPGSADGKRAWLRRHLPALEKGITFTSEPWRLAAPSKLLIDDHDANVAAFRAPPSGSPGGVTLLAPRPWNASRSFCLRGSWAFNVDAVSTWALDLALRPGGLPTAEEPPRCSN